jgi:hypothetical protein
MLIISIVVSKRDFELEQFQEYNPSTPCNHGFLQAMRSNSSPLAFAGNSLSTTGAGINDSATTGTSVGESAGSSRSVSTTRGRGRGRGRGNGNGRGRGNGITQSRTRPRSPSDGSNNQHPSTRMRANYQ